MNKKKNNDMANNVADEVVVTINATALNDLYPAMFATAVDKAAMISDMVECVSDGSGRTYASVMLFKIGRQGFFMIFLCIYHPSYLERVMIP